MLVKLDGAIARILAKAKTVAKTKKVKHIFLVKLPTKWWWCNNNFTIHQTQSFILNYIGYAISLETMNTLYGDMGKDVDGLIEWIEGNKE